MFILYLPSGTALVRLSSNLHTPTQALYQEMRGFGFLVVGVFALLIQAYPTYH